jgi:hypothetical protein
LAYRYRVRRAKRTQPEESTGQSIAALPGSLRKQANGFDKQLMRGQPSFRLGWIVVALTTVAMFAAAVAMFVV